MDDQAPSMDSYGGGGSFYGYQNWAEKNTTIENVLDFTDLIVQLEENFRGKYLRDNTGQVVFNTEEYTDERTGKTFNIRTTPIIVGRPFLVTSRGRFAEKACESILTWVKTFLAKDTVLGNLKAQDISNIMVLFIPGIIRYVAENQKRWDLDKSVMKAATRMIILKTFSTLKRSELNQEWSNISRMGTQRETVTVQERPPEQAGGAGLFGRTNRDIR